MLLSIILTLEPVSTINFIHLVVEYCENSFCVAVTVYICFISNYLNHLRLRFEYFFKVSIFLAFTTSCFSGWKTCIFYNMPSRPHRKHSFLLCCTGFPPLLSEYHLCCSNILFLFFSSLIFFMPTFHNFIHFFVVSFNLCLFLLYDCCLTC